MWRSAQDVDVEKEEPWCSWLATHAHVRRLDVGQLDDEAAATLVTATAGGRRLPPDVVEFVLRQCAGVPLTIEQVRALRRSRAAEWIAIGWRCRTTPAAASPRAFLFVLRGL